MKEIEVLIFEKKIDLMRFDHNKLTNCIRRNINVNFEYKFRSYYLNDNTLKIYLIFWV